MRASLRARPASASLTAGIDVVLHIPDGAGGLLQVWRASHFQLLPAPGEGHRGLSGGLKLTRVALSAALRPTEPLFSPQWPCSLRPPTTLGVVCLSDRRRVRTSVHQDTDLELCSVTHLMPFSSIYP